MRLIAFHPLLKDLHMLGIFMHLTHRYLVGAPEVFGALAVDFLWTRPALGCAQNNHRPARAPSLPASDFVRFGLNLFNLRNDSIEGGRHQRVHLFRFVALDKIGSVTVSAKQLLQLFMTDAR